MHTIIMKIDAGTITLVREHGTPLRATFEAKPSEANNWDADQTRATIEFQPHELTEFIKTLEFLQLR